MKPIKVKEAVLIRDFKDKFMRMLGPIPLKDQAHILKAGWLDTPLGSMMAIADEHELYLLEFIEWRGLELAVERLKEKTKLDIILGNTPIINSIESELTQYFAGDLSVFKTPLKFLGTDFQIKVWNELKKIPLGETRSYADIARKVGKSSAFRAVAQANSVNKFAIVIPCHRVINANGELGGYGGGLHRKQWLLDHEKQMQPTIVKNNKRKSCV